MPGLRISHGVLQLIAETVLIKLPFMQTLAFHSFLFFLGNGAYLVAFSVNVIDLLRLSHTLPMLLLLLLTPNKILKKTENRVLLSVSEWGPSTVGRTRKKKI